MFVNGKGWQSVNVQAICGHKSTDILFKSILVPIYSLQNSYFRISTMHANYNIGKFINIDAQLPGSTLYSYIFRSSEVGTFLETHNRGVEDGYLLGDSG